MGIQSTFCGLAINHTLIMKSLMHHHVPRYCRQNAKGNHCLGSIHHQDQNHCSNRCGSPSKNTTNAAHPLSTENASKLYLYFCSLFYQLVLLYPCCSRTHQHVHSNIPKRGKL